MGKDLPELLIIPVSSTVTSETPEEAGITEMQTLNSVVTCDILLGGATRSKLYSWEKEGTHKGSLHLLSVPAHPIHPSASSTPLRCRTYRSKQEEGTLPTACRPRAGLPQSICQQEYSPTCLKISGTGIFISERLASHHKGLRQEREKLLVVGRTAEEF